MTDINHAMLSADETVSDFTANPCWSPSAMEKLPFPNDYFDCVTVAFRPSQHDPQDRALAEMRPVLQPGGCLLVLEFS